MIVIKFISAQYKKGILKKYLVVKVKNFSEKSAMKFKCLIV